MRTSLRIALALLLALPLSVRAQSGVGEVSLPIGTVGPGAALEDLQGNPVDLASYVRGKPAIIEFWATWCELCERLQPQLDRIQQVLPGGREYAIPSFKPRISPCGSCTSAGSGGRRSAAWSRWCRASRGRSPVAATTCGS